MPTPQKPSGRRRRPVQDRSRHTVESILEAATQLFDRGGTTTGRIAKLAGVSIGSLYEYFPNKDAILGRLFETHVDEAVQALADTLRELPPDRTPLSVGVRSMVAQLLGLHEGRPGLQRTFIVELAALPAVRARVGKAELRLRTELVDWLRVHPEVAVPDLELATRLVVEGSNALVHGFVERREGTTPDTFIDEVARLWTGYLRGNGPVPPNSPTEAPCS